MAFIHVLDLGNVLLFVHQEWFFESLCARVDLGTPIERLFAEHFERERVDRGGDFDAVHSALVREGGLKMSTEEFRLAWNDMFTPNPPMLELVPGLPRPRFLLSNTNEPHVSWIRERYPEVFPLFDHCVFSNDVGMRKPDLAIFRHVEGLTGRPPAEHVFIDDLDRHVRGARSAGWRAIHFEGVEDCRRRLAALAGEG
jgi:putative hydrolase of the HAD superfamily